MARDLSVLIPARNEMFLKHTVEDVLKNLRADTEVIVVADGQWPVEPLDVHERVKLLYNPTPAGQRGATNQAAKISKARYIMKLDAHCLVDEGFDVKLMEAAALLGREVTQIPSMYNLHVFDWMCDSCGNRTYQGPTLMKCVKCGGKGPFHREFVWKPRKNRLTQAWRFDADLHFQYWGEYKRRPEFQDDYPEMLCQIGACWFLDREWYWELGGLDENHGSWGQMGVEISCKSWLSGGRQVVNKKTWFSHLFRTQGGDFGFPYDQPARAVEKARQYSRDLWKNDKWPLAKRKFQWLIDKFDPVPGFEKMKQSTKGVVFYTGNRCPEPIFTAVKDRLYHLCNGMRLVSVSLAPVDLGKNFVLDLPYGTLTMFKEILKGLEECEADVVFLCENDVLYHPSHFEFTPPKKDVYYYNEHTYKVDAETGQAVFYYTKQTSGLCAYRSLLLEHYRKRVERFEKEPFTRATGFEPGCHKMPRGVDNFPAERWMSPFPNVDVRHSQNLTQTRWDPSEFRDPKACQGWKLVDEVPGWGVTKGRFQEFLRDVNKEWVVMA